MTLSTIKSRLERRLKDINDLSKDVLLDMATDLNQFLWRKTYEVDPERVMSTASYAVSTSPSTNALPTDFRNITPIGCGFFFQGADGNPTEDKLPLTSYGSISQGFYMDGPNVVFTGLNSAVTILLRYIPTIDDMTSLSDDFCIDDEFKELVLSGMTMKYYQYEEDPREGLEDEKFARLLGDYLTAIRKAPMIFRITTSINQGA